jgi:hypothetical protein
MESLKTAEDKMVSAFITILVILGCALAAVILLLVKVFS